MSAKIGIDMLDVGKGDSFIIELYDQNDTKFTVVIDGGTSEKGEEAVSHVDSYHGGVIDLAICTHPDMDHIGGLITVFEKCKVNHLIINDPRDISTQDVLIEKARKNLSPNEAAIFKSAFERIDDLKKVAAKQNTKIHSVYGQDSTIFQHGDWNAYILGPTEDLFRDIWLSDDVVKYWFNTDVVVDKSNEGIIDDPAIDTKPVNNSSIILLIEGHGRKYLFTGDAGKRALRNAASIRDISKLLWLDVPHHGSRRNIDSELITYFSPEVSYISSPGTSKHPRKAVIKALQKAKSRVYSTCKNGHMYHNANNPRDSFSTATPWPVL